MRVEFEEGRDLCRTHVCAVCEKGLILAWDSEGSFYNLLCGRDRSHEGVKKMLTPSAAHRQGILQHPAVEEGLRKAELKREREKESAFPLAVVDGATGQIAAPEARELALDMAKRLGLKPDLGHIMLYHGKPWITIDGWYFLLRQKYPKAHLKSMPCSQVDRALLNVLPEIHAWQAVVVSEEGQPLSIGHGFAREGEKGPLARGSAVEQTWPWRMAEKRAEEDAIRKALGVDEVKEKTDEAAALD